VDYGRLLFFSIWSSWGNNKRIWVKNSRRLGGANRASCYRAPSLFAFLMSSPWVDLQPMLIELFNGCSHCSYRLQSHLPCYTQITRVLQAW
jgi:hypothetical protein